MSKQEVNQSKFGDGNEFTEDSEYRIYHKTCTECGKEFKLNIPKHLSIEKKTIKNIMERTTCDDCTTKEK
jgi:hypothetical protein